MSYLKEKSNFNIDAAEILQNKSLYAPSVHCSYYSCLQLMKVAIIEFFEISFEELDHEIKTAKENNKGNTHEYIIKKIGDNIRYNSKDEFRIFHRNIRDLKNFRIKSDYENFQITTTESFKAFKIAKEIRAQLKETFHI